jgi:hypothetical protein
MPKGQCTSSMPKLLGNWIYLQKLFSGHFF